MLSEPHDADLKQEFRARFIPGGVLFVLEPVSPLDSARQLFLNQAVYKLGSLIQYDEPAHGTKASDALADAVRLAPAITELRREVTQHNLGQAALTMQQIAPPDADQDE